MSLHRERTHPVPVEGCDGCKYGGVRFNVARLRNDNRNHMTQREMAQETIDASVAAGTPIESTKRWI